MSSTIGEVLSELADGPCDASLILTTVGGDIHQAFRLITFLHALFESVDIVVFSRCKSAGTLMAIGATKIAMSITGELGPLDVQIRKTDEIAQRESGLETTNSLGVLYMEAFAAFEKYMLLLISKSYTAISTATACRIASDLVSGIFGPIAAQIDPYKMASVSRSVAIAEAYGTRLSRITNNLKPDSLDQLVRGYPDHAFVINKSEAESLFINVRDPTNSELEAHQSIMNEGLADASADPPNVRVVPRKKQKSQDSGDSDAPDRDQTNPDDEEENENNGEGVSPGNLPAANNMARSSSGKNYD